MNCFEYFSRILPVIMLICCFSIYPSSGLTMEEKPIPPQHKLDACFAGGFHMASQIRETYTNEELNALDRALSAMNMTPHDMNFRKDYTEGHLAFPLILDMMKHPLHIAPYMDGFTRSIDTLTDKRVLAVPEILACAMMHPGISKQDLDAQYMMMNSSRKNMERDGSKYILNSITQSAKYIQQALKELDEEQLRLLRLKLPEIMTWHKVFESPYDEEKTSEMQNTLEGESDAYIDELATKIDLTQMILAYTLLPDPWVLMELFEEKDVPRSEPLYFATPWGMMVIGTYGNDTYTGDFAIMIEPGGNDVYKNCRIGSAAGTEENRIGFFLDLGGDDHYFCEDMNFTLGAAVMGVSAFYDLGGGNDIYQGGHVSQGAAMCGITSLYDDGGADRYSCKVFGQGAAGYGIGVMVDRAPEIEVDLISPANKEDEEIDETVIQNDWYGAWLMAQGFSRQYGVGLCHGSRGNDVYHAGGIYLHAPLFNDRYQSFSQGFSIGSRDIDYAGGLAFLIDENGNDYYLGDIYNQGVGYWYSGGFLIDRGGNDHYEMTQYGQGSGIHLAIGGIIDESGNDSYTMNSGLGQGGSHDFAASVMMDRGGLDRYMGSTSCNGCGLTNAVGLFFDRTGDDIYGGIPSAQTLGGGRWARDTGSIGIFIDTGGKDSYFGEAKNETLWTHNQFGAGFDLEPVKKDEEELKTTGQADQTRDESKIDIPEICSYEGELTDEVFDELWEIATRWEVGDNRVIVPKARERLIAFGSDILPKLDEKFDDTYALSLRAYQDILEGLQENHQNDVITMLRKNLESDDEGRNRNALYLVGQLKLKDLDTGVAGFLDHEKLRGTAISTIGSIGSPIANDKLRSFINPDQEERTILRATAALLDLGVYEIYPRLRKLLDHEFFTVREGIIAMIANHYDEFNEDVFQDLKTASENPRFRVSLLKIVAKFPELPPSMNLYRTVSKNLESDDPVVRAFAVEVLQHWLTFEDDDWLSLQKKIIHRLDKMKKVERDIYVRCLLNCEQ